MIGSHPGGIDLTNRLLQLSQIKSPAKILDLGAGTGESVKFLRETGYTATGVDLKVNERGDLVLCQDMTDLDFEDGSFDVCLAECSVSVCGDGMAALAEAYRVLRPGGSLLISDVFFEREDAPVMSMGASLTWDCWKNAFIRSGFQICAVQNETDLWREFFLESLWNGNADEDCCEFFRTAGRSKCGYFAAWLMKKRE